MTVEIRIGDALDQLREMPDESVHCCVTSPPYWGLRDYGVDCQIGLEETPYEWCARLVADRLQRNAVLIELNAEYAAMAQRRIDGDRGGLLDIIEQSKSEQMTMDVEGRA